MPTASAYPCDAPLADVVEVCLFGPGVGECVVTHLGGGKWLVVDSCIGHGGRAVALEYLDAIGVPTSAIVLVIATHWHDDHIRGLAEVVAAVSSAGFVCSGALRSEEFLSLISASAPVKRTTKLGSGIDEMTSILSFLRSGGRHPTWTSQNQTIMRDEIAGTLLTSLSPSSATLTRSLLGFTGMMPKLRAALRVIPDVSPNETSVVLHLQLGNAVVLLGADLEVTPSPAAGWHAIVGSAERPTARASVYKIAHHGSQTADTSGIWATLLADLPTSLLSPFTRSQLPKPEDVERIRTVAGRLFQSARSKTQPIRRDSAVDRTVRMMAKKPPTPRRGNMGQVRVRLSRSTGLVVSTDVFGAAFEVPAGRTA